VGVRGVGGGGEGRRRDHARCSPNPLHTTRCAPRLTSPTHALTLTHARTHARTRARARAHTHTYTHTHTHTHSTLAQKTADSLALGIRAICYELKADKEEVREWLGGWMDVGVGWCVD
jgi:hypothetical protein